MEIHHLLLFLPQPEEELMKKGIVKAQPKDTFVIKRRNDGTLSILFQEMKKFPIVSRSPAIFSYT